MSRPAAGPTPPRWSERLLARLLPTRDREAILGDLAEAFRVEARVRGAAAARGWYRREVLRSLVPALRRRLAASAGRPAHGARAHEGTFGGGGGGVGRWQMDVRVAVRSLIRRPGFSAVVLLTLAVGVGASTAVFGVVDGVLLRPLPFPQVDRVHYLWERVPDGRSSWVSSPNFLDWRDGLTAYEHVAAVSPGGFNASGSAGPERIDGLEVTPGFFEVLGVDLALGRGFAPEEGRDGGARVVVVSHGLWQRQLAGAPDVLGRALLLEDEPFEIVGVVPEGAAFPSDADVWVPLDPMAEEWMTRRGIKWLNVLARLRPGVDAAAASRDLEVVSAAIAADQPDVPDGSGIAVEPLSSEILGGVRVPLLILTAAVALVLLAVAVNVAGLFLVQAAARRKEAAIRRSLGAAGSNLAGRFLTETMLLSVAGGALGILFAFQAVRLLRAMAPAGTPRIEDAAVSPAVLLAGLGVAVLVGLVSGIAPAIREAGVDPTEGLRADGDRTSGRGHRSRRALVVAQVAIAVVLVAGAGHLLETFRNLRAVDPGFDPAPVLTAWLPLSESRYATDEALESFYTSVLEAVRGIPSVDEAGVVSLLPFGGGVVNTSFELRDAAALAPGEELVAGYQSASAGYFEAMGIEVLRGRAFAEGEGPEDEPVVIVDEAFAERFLGGVDPLGQEILLRDAWRRVVGVVGSVRRRSLRSDPVAMFYLPLGQDPSDAMTLVMRAGGLGEPAALAPEVRRIVAAVDPAQPVADIATLASLVESSLAQPRFTATVVAFFGAATLFLAMLGVYGAASHLVTRRTHEMAIRMALGARQGDVRTIVVGQGMALAAAGLVLGMAAAWPAVRLLRTALFGVSPFQPAIVLSVAGVLLGAAALACWLPARRATRVDPAVTLRGD